MKIYISKEENLIECVRDNGQRFIIIANDEDMDKCNELLNIERKYKFLYAEANKNTMTFVSELVCNEVKKGE